VNLALSIIFLLVTSCYCCLLEFILHYCYRWARIFLVTVIIYTACLSVSISTLKRKLTNLFFLINTVWNSWLLFGFMRFCLIFKISGKVCNCADWLTSNARFLHLTCKLQFVVTVIDNQMALRFWYEVFLV
jgi:hypothetical protein